MTCLGSVEGIIESGDFGAPAVTFGVYFTAAAATFTTR